MNKIKIPLVEAGEWPVQPISTILESEFLAMATANHIVAISALMSL